MKTKEQILGILRNEMPYMSKEYNVVRIGVFGSFAKNISHNRSDVDIVVEFDKPIGLKFITLANYLELKLSKKIDLLTIEGVNAIRNKKIAEEIKRNLIYA